MANPGKITNGSQVRHLHTLSPCSYGANTAIRLVLHHVQANAKVVRETGYLLSGESALSPFTSCLRAVRSFVFLVQVVSGQELLAALEKLGSQSGQHRAETNIVNSGVVVEGESAAPAS